MSHKQPGLDDRHRDNNGRISMKHGNTEVGNLRKTYGGGFAEGRRADTQLKTILNDSGSKSLSDFLKKK